MSGESPQKNTNLQVSNRESFLRKLDGVLESNLDNERFGVGELAEALNLSRMQVYRKVRKLTGKNVSRYIRENRLKFALEMLRDEEVTVSEIAYKVGFGSVSYFSNCFRKHYGYPPGQVKEEVKNFEPENQIPGNSNTDRRRIIMWMGSVSLVIVLFISGYFAFESLSEEKSHDVNPGTGSLEDKSIAVLPFHNDSPSRENEYFCNGMMEEILTHLQKIAGLQIKSRMAVEQYRNTTLDPGTIGAELGSNYLIEGSVRKVGNNVRVTVQLIDSRTGNHVWAEPYDGKYTIDLLKFQSNVAQKIVASINARITEQERRRIEKTTETDIEVYDYILRARELIGQFWATHNRDYLPTILFFIEKALEIDQNSPLANAVKAGYFTAYAFIQNEEIRNRSKDSALYYLDKAINKNPESLIAYRIKADVYLNNGNREKAIESLTETLELAPNDVDNVLLYSRLLMEGQPTKEDLIKAYSYRRRAINLFGENTKEGLFWKGAYYYNFRNYKKGNEYTLKSIKAGFTHPSYAMLSFNLLIRGKAREAIQFLDTIVADQKYDSSCYQRYFWAYLELNQWEKAEETLDMVFNNDFKKLFSAYLYIQTGRKEKGRSELNELKQKIANSLSEKKTFMEFNKMIVIHSMLNEKEQALAYLSEFEKSYIWTKNLDTYQNSFLFKNIQQDPRFKTIMKRAEDKFTAVREKIRELEIEENFDM
jgi:TolB-like protein/AraC-like DNA-binding protein